LRRPRAVSHRRFRNPALTGIALSRRIADSIVQRYVPEEFAGV
jgi:hypothetical protein